MNTYTYKCPTCGAALEFDPKSQLLICDHCGQMYLPSDVSKADEEISAPSQNNTWQPAYGTQGEAIYQQPAYGGQGEAIYQQSYVAEYENNTPVQEDAINYIDVNVYNCGSCGAEIMTNDVEVTKYCAYCGQPTIMFDRVSRERRPDKIIPFMLTKEQALQKAKEKFSTAKFLADGIENVTVTSVYGIYMPYFAYNLDMHLSVNVEYTYNKTHRSEWVKKGRKHSVLLDASERFNDYVSKQLNPFPVANATEFDALYLTGFCADRNDVLLENRIEDAKDYLREILVDEAADSLPGVPQKQLRESYKAMYEKTGAFRVHVDSESTDLQSCEYYFCPVYFITFNVAGEHIILLVNGCTGKVVGTIPVDNKKLEKRRRIDMLVYAIVFGGIGAALFGYMPILWSALLFAIVVISMVLAGASAKKRYREMYAKTNSESMFALSKNRE